MEKQTIKRVLKYLDKDLFIVILTVDEHKRTERKQKKLMEKLERLKDKTSF